MEFDLTVEALRENDQTTRVVFEDREDTEMSFGVLPWSSDDDEDETEVRAPERPWRARKWASRAGPALYPSVEAILPAPAAAVMEPRARRGRTVSLISLGMLCFALATVLLTQERPVGSIRRLPAGTTVREAAAPSTDATRLQTVDSDDRAPRPDAVLKPVSPQLPKTAARTRAVARAKRNRR